MPLEVLIYVISLGISTDAAVLSGNGQFESMSRGPRVPDTRSARRPVANASAIDTDSLRNTVSPMHIVSGRVILNDGVLPTDAIPIQRLCHGRGPEIIGYTDPKGLFSIDLVSPSVGGFAHEPGPEWQGRSNQRNLPEFARCELRAYLAGFRSDVIQLAGRKVLDHPEVGTIILHRTYGIEGTTVSATTALAPSAARKAFEKAVRCRSKGKPQDAARWLAKSIEIYPKYALALDELGKQRAQGGEFEAAIAAFKQAIAADRTFTTPYMDWASVEATRQAWPEVARITDQVLRLNPVDLPDAWILNGIANLVLQRFEAAEKNARELERLEVWKTHPQADQIVGLVHARRARWPEAVLHLHRYVGRTRPGPDRDVGIQQLVIAEKQAASEIQRLNSVNQ